ncbi:MAG: LysM peptidoglycan-binding domain-containing protein [Bacteroidales bacterium]|nr:LysM peptidoglycan-binding domain-containing protein [Bacteroidales bacterium]
MKKIRHFLFLFIGLTVLTAFRSPSDKTPQEAYIEKYSAIAVMEMYRSGIPASITLAQGLLESGYGRSELALKSNNHFGIKCHNGWQGGKVYHDDDAKGECFRKYDSPEESYRDHSDFLRYRDRYKFLFEYKITDYQSWAYGLKKAGYATDPNYPRKLINLIEEYQLHLYDTTQPPVQEPKETSSKGENKQKVRKEPAPQTIPTPPAQLEQVHKVTSSSRETFRFSLSREMYSQNGVLFVYAAEGETYDSIAESNRLFLKELLRFNDLKEDVPLKPGTVVYLQKKKKESAPGLEMHVIEKGETLRGISQRYGVRLDRLCKINGIEDSNVIREGDIIRLRK